MKNIQNKVRSYFTWCISNFFSYAQLSWKVREGGGGKKKNGTFVGQ